LLRTIDWTGLKLAKEIMINNGAVANLIRENDLHQIPSIIQMWARESMQLIEKDVVDLIQRGDITEEEWLKYANNPKIVREALAENS
jgi:twitching motility protein PilT